MTKSKKDFSNQLNESVRDEPEEKKQEPTEPEPLPEKKEYVKIVLRMQKDDHEALQRIALNEAARMGKRYSLTELINDILKSYLNTEGE